MKYKLNDDRIVDTAEAVERYEEAIYWDDHRRISRATNSEWEHERLCCSPRGTWYVEAWSDWQGTSPTATEISEREAVAWLLSQGCDLPVSLAHAADVIPEYIRTIVRWLP